MASKNVEVTGSSIPMIIGGAVVVFIICMMCCSFFLKIKSGSGSSSSAAIPAPVAVSSVSVSGTTSAAAVSGTTSAAAVSGTTSAAAVSGTTSAAAVSGTTTTSMPYITPNEYFAGYYKDAFIEGFSLSTGVNNTIKLRGENDCRNYVNTYNQNFPENPYVAYDIRVGSNWGSILENACRFYTKSNIEKPTNTKILDVTFKTKCIDPTKYPTNRCLSMAY